MQAQELAVDVYSLKTSNFMQTINKFNFENFIEENKKNIGAKEDILAVQDFIYGTDEWRSAFFTGWGDQRLRTPPDVINGFAARELPRDEDIVRYIDTRKPNIVRVITFNLGAGFDSMMTTIDSETARFESINSISLNKIIPFLLLYFVIFLFPILLITIIIAISFTQNISKPIIDLSEATMQVAEGDFSVHILKSPKDELGELIRNFNVMVQNLEKTQNALARSEKISIWQTMAVQLAHEIKNPLTPIKLTAERVLRRFRDDPQKTQDILEDSMLAIIQEVESLSTLLDEFKTLSRPIEASKSNTNIKDAVNEIIAPYITSCPKVTFSTETMYTSVNVRIEKKHLTQIVNNLVINAIDAMNSDGRIEIKTEIVNKHDTRYCRLSIKDNGKGINPENAKSVWTPYWTTKNSGTGLGLPIVERIVLEYDGGIWFNSASGAGTTFFVDLPVV
ncbi:hypothetical protein FACS1894190_03030 [Spirochaetia bacterium]|nr:hypothetical protein FACS1894190_03030 [Spirochaetia bacterium]